MKSFTNDEKIAILKVLSEIMMADNIIHKNEVSYMNEVARELDINTDYNAFVEKQTTLLALLTIKEMSTEQRSEVAKYMGKMIVVDNDINYNEVRMYNAFCDFCNIGNEFNFDDYLTTSTKSIIAQIEQEETLPF